MGGPGSRSGPADERNRCRQHPIQSEWRHSRQGRRFAPDFNGDGYGDLVYNAEPGRRFAYGLAVRV